MATKYVTQAGDGDNSGDTLAKAYAAAAITWTTGNTYYIVGTITTALNPDAAGVIIRGDHATYDAGVIDGVAKGVFWADLSSIEVHGLEIKNCSRNGVRVSCDSNTTLTGILLSDLHIHNIGPGTAESAQEDGTGIFIRTSADTRAQLNGAIRNCVIHDCGRHGIDLRWRVMSMTVSGCTAYNCGTDVAGHGFRVNPMSETLTSGWTQVGGTDVYNRLYTSASDVPQRIVNYTDGVQLVQNTGTPTAPGANEWGLETVGCPLGGSGKCIYVNMGVGVSPNGKSLIVKRNTQGTIRFENCESYENVAAVAAEGHGASADDMAGPVVWVACNFHDNAGNGLSLNFSEDCEAQGCLLNDNTLAGVNVNLSDACAIKNCTADGNTTYGVRALTTSINLTVANTLARDNTDTGIGVSTATATTLTETTNAAADNGTNFTNATGTEARSGAGTWLAGVRAYDDLPLPLAPDIGAVQDRNAPGRRFGVGGGTL